MPQETLIHPSAVVEKGAELGAGVRIGPFCHVGPQAIIGDRTELVSQVTILGETTLGEGCQVYPTAVLGGPPQDFKYKGGRTTLTVGRNCIIREGMTVHRGTETGRGRTVVGDDCYLMAYSHVAHDCIVGNKVTMANYAGLGGHSEIGDAVIMSGYAAVHQFVRVGHHAFLGGFAAVVGDVIPYGMAVGDRAKLRGLNVIGMKRSGMPRSELVQLRKAYRMLFDPDQPLAANIGRVATAFPDSAVVADMLRFVAGKDKRHFTVPPRGRAIDDDDDGED
ncbi:acyl-ACP--UDP-N-acetylglucosamine O-acyltransferase [Nitratireductor luteus]|uniref:acyl-ACP--UDP-N-acetylglucosamine O-acyltransferase n=1 Tax=Nitratireductor luteus TaxID=2976980 RepID=UPI002240333A|nr:acyl-ACP--UDP-N-acetylglucosamine O-acyltransferase [Nitratireductor luteus]